MCPPSAEHYAHRASFSASCMSTGFPPGRFGSGTRNFSPSGPATCTTRRHTHTLMWLVQARSYVIALPPPPNLDHVIASSAWRFRARRWCVCRRVRSVAQRAGVLTTIAFRPGPSSTYCWPLVRPASPPFNANVPAQTGCFQLGQWDYRVFKP